VRPEALRSPTTHPPPSPRTLQALQTKRRLEPPRPPEPQYVTEDKKPTRHITEWAF
jgi:hypothetical protein